MSNVEQPLHLPRRGVLKLTAGAAAALAGLGYLPKGALADKAKLDEAIMKRVRKAPQASNKVILDVPQIAENGNTVPVSFEVDSPMTDGDYIKDVHVFADGNPNPDVASFRFTPASGQASASTRIRLAKTQNIVAVAETSKGEVLIAQAPVKVTIGGCGG